MNELEIAKALIRILVCYGIVRNWSKDELFKTYTNGFSKRYTLQGDGIESSVRIISMSRVLCF